MTRLNRTAYLTIHGHFYQPPRENPWTERIELQPDAKPFHNWNDRILIQCYQPNAMARIVDAEGKVLEIVNNFRLLNFNVGPTLLSWLEKYAPVMYHRILEGDRLSLHDHSGHGNAIAQVYNHMIMPLAREEEQRTQVRWGICEFKKRFGRDPEGMWLPETAATERTLEILMEEGIRFTILAPEQAARIRPLQPPEAPWQDVSAGSIDPTRPYRFFHSKDPKRWMDLFFFDGPLSRDMSFLDLLFDAKKFVQRLIIAHRNDRQHPELIHVATDGETFGHHKAYGERVIAFLLQHEAERHGFKRMNYGEYLEKFPPQFEVKIKPGEGTSWSCPHGVGRWKEDCGCHTGGQAGWNQKWRKPLREAVCFLEEALAKLYEKEGQVFFKNPMAARDGYIDLILGRSPKAREKFFQKFSIHPLNEAEQIRAIKLLEMERLAMLTETSCGWFFNDISGIETVQILRYALKALELAEEFGGASLESEFVAKLAHTKSNRAEFKDGRGVWEKLVKPSRVAPEKIVAHFAFRKFFGLKIEEKDFYNYRVEEIEEKPSTGKVRLTGITIPESREFIYTVAQDDSHIQCFVKNGTGGENELFSLADLFPDERDEILRLLSRQTRENFYQTTLRFYEKNRQGIRLFHDAGGPAPEEFREAMEWVLGERLYEGVQKLKTQASLEMTPELKAVLEEAQSGGFAIRTEPAVQFLSKKLNAWIEKLFHDPDSELIHKIENVLEFAKKLNLVLHDRIAQDLFFVFAQKILREWIESYHRLPRDPKNLERIQAVLRLGDQLGFNMKPYENQLKTKAEVR